MKKIISSLILFVLGSLAWGSSTNFSTPVVAKQFQPIRSPATAAPKKASSVNEKVTRSATISPNIIPIITLNDAYHNAQGIPRHEPCAATRLTPTLVFTAAHCLVGGLTHGSRIHAGIFQAKDGVEGLVFSKPHGDDLVQPNAQVFVYRPGLTRPADISAPFDFGVVVLDTQLKLNSKFTQQMTNMLNSVPLATTNKAENLVTQEMQKEFSKQSTAYTQFINKPLEAVALLTMTPQGVSDELQGRRWSVYVWNAYAYESTRDPVQILSQSISKEGTAPNSSHLLLFKGEAFHPGTSGSPIFDTQRKLVVTTANGSTGEASNQLNLGGLIDQAVCQWTKSYDRAVKCLVRHDGVVANEPENLGASTQGR
ncbi:MAG: hypothetical protein MJ053_05215 [Elusimicrobiaceae bacterium]|nr:hypothetical protein [Elusimicrobiaceae bacterium]